MNPLFWMAFLAGACAGKPQPNASAKVSWSPELRLTALDRIPAALDGPMGDECEVTLPDRSRRKVKSCRDFVAVAASGFDVPNDNDWAVIWSQGVRCLALDALVRARPAASSFLTWFTFTPATIGKLPPGLAMMLSEEEFDEARKAQSSCIAWKDFDPDLRIKSLGQGKASLRTEGWTGSLTLYARGDLDGDGIEDLMLRRDGHVVGGTASDALVLIVTQKSARGCPRITRVLGPPSLVEAHGEPSHEGPAR